MYIIQYRTSSSVVITAIYSTLELANSIDTALGPECERFRRRSSEASQTTERQIRTSVDTTRSREMKAWSNELWRGRSKIVIGVDLGTTHSGVSYAYLFNGWVFHPPPYI